MCWLDAPCRALPRGDYAYVNPVVVVILGGYLDDDRPADRDRGAVIVVSVAIIVTTRGRMYAHALSASPAVPEASP
jgi:hypothetical protein